MRTEVNWKEIKYFKPQNPWGDVSKVNPDLIYLIDEFRAYVGKPFILHNAYEKSGHNDDSQHYLGLALDGHFVDLHWMDQFLLAMKFGKFNGVGVYPDWNNPGLHLDIRQNKNDTNSTWVRYKGKYYPVNYSNIMMILDDQQHSKK